MSIDRYELQPLLVQTRQFIRLTTSYIEQRNKDLKDIAFDDALHINYGVGAVVLNNLYKADQRLAKLASQQYLASSTDKWDRISNAALHKLFGKSEHDSQYQLAQTAKLINQTLLRAEEWLKYEWHNIHTGKLAIPVQAHRKYDEFLIAVKKKFAEVMSSEHFSNVFKYQLPQSQTKSWLSEEMLQGLLFLRIRVNDYALDGLQDRFRALLPEVKNFDAYSKALIDATQQNLAGLDIDKVLHDLKHETNETRKYFEHNDEADVFLPEKALEQHLAAFQKLKNRKPEGSQFTRDELKPIVEVEKDMPRPDGFGRKSTSR